MVIKRKALFFYIASFLIPAALLTLALARSAIVPFGNNTLLWEDAGIQYVDFFTYLRTIFAGENDVLYSFSKNLGGEMVSLIAYYLLSPFNLLFALGTDETVPLIYTIVAVLKLSLCGLTFFHASARRFGCRGIHLAFSTAYALMAYNVIYCWSVMWLDGVLILPLLALGLEGLWKGKTHWLYTWSLFYGLLTNFYIGYMLCIASVLFSVVHFALLKGPLSRKMAAFGRFAAASCIGGLASAFVWVPAFMSLLEGRAKFDGNATGLLFSFNVLGLAGKLVAGSCNPLQLVVGTPHIFCGMLVMLLALVFFLNRGISGKGRLCALGVLAVIFVSFVIRPINVIWHGFSPNYAFNFRYAFLFSYVLIVVAQYSLERVGTLDRRALVLVGGLLTVLVFGLVAVRGILNLEYLSVAGCAVSLAALVVSFVALFCPGKLRTFLCLVLILVSVVEMGANLCLSWESVVPDPEFSLLRTETYDPFREAVGDGVDYVRELDGGFYRMEKDFWHDMNDPMTFGYNGLSHFSSSQQKHVMPFLEKMGFKNDRDICVYYRTGSTAEVDSLLGVKYLLSRGDMTDAKGYEHLATVGDVQVYRNLNALPIAMVSKDGLENVQMAQEDYFALHNAIWQAISGEEMPILIPAAYTMTLENLIAVELEEGGTRYIQEDETRPAFLRFEIPVTQEGPLYYFFTADGAQDADIYVNGVYDGYYFHELRWDMTNAGCYDVGQTVVIEMVLTSEQVAFQDALFYYEDLDALQAHADAIRNRETTLDRLSSSHLTGSFTLAEGEQLLLTIPYDTGWQVYVDGVKTEAIRVLDSLMAVQAEPGQHAFEMRYIPRGGIAGCWVAAAAWLAAGGWWLLQKKKEGYHGEETE